MVAHSLIISQAIAVDHLQLLAFILITTNKKQCLMCDALNLLGGELLQHVTVETLARKLCDIRLHK